MVLLYNSIPTDEDANRRLVSRMMCCVDLPDSFPDPGDLHGRTLILHYIPSSWNDLDVNGWFARWGGLGMPESTTIIPGWCGVRRGVPGEEGSSRALLVFSENEMANNAYDQYRAEFEGHPSLDYWSAPEQFATQLTVSQSESESESNSQASARSATPTQRVLPPHPRGTKDVGVQASFSAVSRAPSISLSNSSSGSFRVPLTPTQKTQHSKGRENIPVAGPSGIRRSASQRSNSA